MVTTHKPLDTFSGLRGLCAPLIVLHHALLFCGSPDIFPSGYYTISIFGGMSGFVLAQAYGDRFNAGMGIRAFMGKRLQRLYPSVAAAHFISLPGLRGGDLALWLSAPLGFLILPNPLTSELFPLNPPLWWLLFDLLANFMLVLLWKRLSAMTLGILIVGGAVMSLVLQLQLGTQDGGHDWNTFLMGFVRIVCAFFVGVALARIRIAPPKVSPWLVLVAVVAISAIRPMGALQPVMDLTANLLLVPAVLWFAAGNEPAGLTRQLFRFLGKISFALYLTHAVVLHVAQSFLNHFHLPFTLWVALGLFPPMLFGSWLFNRYFEIPVAQWLSDPRRKLRRKAPAAPAPAGIEQSPA